MVHCSCAVGWADLISNVCISDYIFEVFLCNDIFFGRAVQLYGMLYWLLNICIEYIHILLFEGQERHSACKISARAGQKFLLWTTFGRGPPNLGWSPKEKARETKIESINSVGSNNVRIYIASDIFENMFIVTRGLFVRFIMNIVQTSHYINAHSWYELKFV